MSKITLCAIGALAFMLLLLAAWQAPLVARDEPLWFERSSRAIWRTNGPYDYPLAVDVPGGVRLLYWCVMQAVDHRGANIPADYSVTYEEEIARGSGAPADAVLAMRTGNVGMFAVGLAALGFVAWRVSRRWWGVALALLPFLLSPRWPYEVVPRVGPDALLFAWLALFLAVWVWAREHGRAHSWKWVAILAFAGGFAAFTKINGALVIIAYAVWLVANRRFARAAAALAGAFAVFYLLNPAFHGASPVDVIGDVLSRRYSVINQLDQSKGALPQLFVWNAIFPCWPVLPLFAVAVWKCRRAWWFAPVACWGVALVVGTAVMIDRAYPRYVAPLEMGLFFPTALALLQLAPWSKPASEEPGGTPQS